MNPSQAATRDDLGHTRPNHDYRCSRCGYGVAIHTPPHTCRMCHSTTWETAQPRQDTAAPINRRT
jgi:lipopolysaccharide biosynthesis regulator YciM